jgi:type IV secretion system protein VirD4
MQTKDADHIARQMGQTYLETQNETRVNGKTYTLAQLQNVLSAPIQWFMSASTFPLLRFASGEPIALFLSTPDQRKSVDPIAVLFFNQLIQALSSEASQSPVKRLPRRVNFVLDEFGQLPPVPQFDRTVSVGLSRGIRMIVAVQNLSQFKQYTDGERETILGNCTTWICLRADNTETAQQLSQRVGQYDHRYTTQQHSASGNTASLQTSWGQQTVARPLLTTDELMRIPEDQAVILQSGHQAASVYLPDLSAWGFESLWDAYPPPGVRFVMNRPAIWSIPAGTADAVEAVAPMPFTPPNPETEASEYTSEVFPLHPDGDTPPVPPNPPSTPETWEIFDDLPF